MNNLLSRSHDSLLVVFRDRHMITGSRYQRLKLQHKDCSEEEELTNFTQNAKTCQEGHSARSLLAPTITTQYNIDPLVPSSSLPQAFDNVRCIQVPADKVTKINGHNL